MKKIKLFCALIALCILLPTAAACQIPGLNSPVVRPPVTEPDYSALNGADIEFVTAREFNSNREQGKVSREFRLAAAEFAVKLLNESRPYAEGNGLLVSPLSVMLALSMTANGAEGETLLEMEKVLAGGMTVDKLNAELFNYTSSLVSSPDAKFNLANAIWVTSDPSFSINKNFVKEIENTFDADIVAAKLDEKATIDAINGWVKEETFGMIDSILKEDDLDEETVMVLLNALAFDALWSDQVDDDYCFDGNFNGADGTVQRVTFMNAACDGYINGEGVSGIVKNYRGGNYAFLALLPDEGTSIYDFMSSLNGKKLLDLYDDREKAAHNVTVSAKMPHFSFDCNVNLNDTLQSMGIKRGFDGSMAEFGALGSSLRGNIFIDKVLHKTHIDLDNSGTRAAAVTAVIMDTESEGGPMDMKYYRVELDRPFIYAIIDTQTGLPIFLGACENIGE